MARTRPAVEPRLLDRIAAAAYCGVSVNHFLAHCPVPPFEGFGAKKLWDRKAIDRWLDGGTWQEDTSQAERERVLAAI